MSNVLLSSDRDRDMTSLNLQPVISGRGKAKRLPITTLTIVGYRRILSIFGRKHTDPVYP
jgi:hypothetical protein